MSVTAELLVNMKILQTGSALGTPTLDVPFRYSANIADGTAAGQADIFYGAVRTVADGANDDIDLAGSLSDAYGSTITAAELVALMLINRPETGANTTDLTLGGGTNPMIGFLGGTTPTVGPIKPGGVLFLAATDAAGIGTVTAGTGDILRITNGSGAANSYTIAMLARSA